MGGKGPGNVDRAPRSIISVEEKQQGGGLRGGGQLGLKWKKMGTKGAEASCEEIN